MQEENNQFDDPPILKRENYMRLTSEEVFEKFMTECVEAITVIAMGLIYVVPWNHTQGTIGPDCMFIDFLKTDQIYSIEREKLVEVMDAIEIDINKSGIANDILMHVECANDETEYLRDSFITYNTYNELKLVKSEMCINA